VPSLKQLLFLEVEKFPSSSQLEECYEGSPTHITSVWSRCCECIFSFRNYLWDMLFGNGKSEADIKFEQSYCNIFSWSFLSFMSGPISIKKLLLILVCGYNWEGFIYCYSVLVGMRWHQWRNCCSKWRTPSSVSRWVWSIHIGTSDMLSTRSPLTPTEEGAPRALQSLRNHEEPL
jgi:hypothetical protein